MTWKTLAGPTALALVLAVSPGCGDDAVEVEGPRGSVHVAFAGGGWRAHTAHAAWTMSLLDDGAVPLADAFASVETLSSNSGGSWFLTMLAYSDSFRTAVEAPGAFADYATTGYLGRQQDLFDDLRVALAAEPDLSVNWCEPFSLFSPELYFYCRIADVAGGGGVVWADVVDRVVFEPYGMNDDLAAVTLDGTRQPWATGKSILLAATLLTDQAVLNEEGVFSGLHKRFYSASLVSGPSQRSASPVTFASTPGGTAAPPFLAAGAFSVGYTTTADSPLTETEAVGAALPTGQVGVLRAASASSAALGAAASRRVLAHNSVPLAWQAAYELSDLAVPFSLHPQPAFASPGGQTVHELAAAQAVRLGDGGYLDNSGVAQLVAFLQATGRGDGFEIVAFDNVQQTYQPAGGAPVGIDLAYLFGEGLADPNELCSGAGRVRFCVPVPEQQVFVSDTLSATQSVWEFPAAASDTTHRLVYTRYQVTTVANASLGVTAGSTGTLHAFSCIWPDAPVAPYNGAAGFAAYRAMLDGIRAGLTADGGAGLGHLRAALAGTGGR